MSDLVEEEREESTVSKLCNLLQDSDPEVVIKSVFELGCLEKDAIPAIPFLVKLCDSPIVEIRVASSAAIGRINASPAQSIPALIRLLADESLPVQRNAAAGLCLFKYEDLSLHSLKDQLRNVFTDSKDQILRSFISSLIARLSDRSQSLSIS